MLLLNSETWTELNSEDEDNLEYLQTQFLSMMLGVPLSCPRPALCWDSGSNKMATRIKIKKLNFLRHVKTLDDETLANAIFKEQQRNGWPGLVVEASQFCEDLIIPDITKPHNKPSKNEWKNVVKKACDEMDERDLRESMKKLSKLTLMKDEVFERKQYLKEMTMQQSRMHFRIRTNKTKCKMNFSSDPKNRDSLWRCDSYESNIDTQ